MKRRIIRADAHNWAIQEWQEGGELVERGRFAGKEKQSKWKVANCFYNKLSDAARAMFEAIVAENWDVTGKDLATMLAESQKAVTDHVAALVAGLETDTMIGVLQERGWTVTAGKKGRASYVDDEASSEPEVEA